MNEIAAAMPLTRTTLAAFALVSSMLASGCGGNGAPSIEQLLADEPGAAILLSRPARGDPVAISAGTSVWDPVNVGAGPALRVGISSDTVDSVLLTVERASEPGLYNVFVEVLPSVSDSIALGTPTVLQNAAGQVLAENARTVGDGFWLSGQVDPEFQNPDTEFIQRTIGAEWLAISFESEDGAFDLVFRPDDFAQEAGNLILEEWLRTDLVADQTTAGLQRPVQLTTSDGRYDGNSFWRAVLVDVGVSKLRISAYFLDLDLLFSVTFSSSGYSSILGVTTLTSNGVNETFLPVAFRAGTGASDPVYFPMPTPISASNDGEMLALEFAPTLAEYYDALVGADFFEIVFQRGEHTIVLRLDKGDQRGHAIVEAAFANVIEWFEQGPTEPPPEPVLLDDDRELWTATD